MWFQFLDLDTTYKHTPPIYVQRTPKTKRKLIAHSYIECAISLPKIWNNKDIYILFPIYGSLFFRNWKKRGQLAKETVLL